MRRLTTAAMFLMLAVLSNDVYAQFSPGELTQAHTNLEGTENCTQCHDVGQKINGEKCLACHVELKARLDAGKGYHAASSVRTKECIACHFEHKGRAFKMIRWEGGKGSFDHNQTGYKLEGKHKTDKCEKCHKPEQIIDPLVRQQAGVSVSLKNTQLGLSRECTTCHFDEHRKQLDAKCEKCHDFENWKESTKKKFDHEKTKYPLEGLHQKVECIKCHSLMEDPKKKPDGSTDKDFANYKKLEFTNCSPCHKDPHQNKFGQNCVKCHDPFGWTHVVMTGFDHSKTKYPLIGEHRHVACEKCHQPDPKKPATYKNMVFANCANCHTDAHAGQFAHRDDKGRCEACHNESGFVPSLFTVERHNLESKYVLAGAHIKPSCNKCHAKLAPAEFKSRTGSVAPGDSSAMIFKFNDRKCSFCHADIHRGQFAEKMKKQDCDICHKAESWKDLVFDHNKDSEFALLGKHKEQKCEKCHKLIDENTSAKRVLYKPVSKLCESCHKDLHEGQFAKQSNLTPSHLITNCEECHNAEKFKPSIFVHNKQSKFALTGAHQKVDCVKCHVLTKIKSDSLITLYKPVASDCASCHTDTHEGVFEIK